MPYADAKAKAAEEKYFQFCAGMPHEASALLVLYEELLVMCYWEYAQGKLKTRIGELLAEEIEEARP